METQVLRDDEGTPIAAVRVVGAFTPVGESETPLVLSNFAWLRRAQDALVVESARGAGTVKLLDPRAVALVAALSSPVDVGDAIKLSGLSAGVVSELLGALMRIGAVLPAPVSGAEHELPFAVWEFHDLLFHARSRRGRHFSALGGTYRFAGRIEPAPALPPRRWPTAIALERPDFERLVREDPPLSAVQADRRSLRRYSEVPINIGELSEFLFRVARVEDVTRAPGQAESFTARPYPAGGSLYELEVYLGVRNCEGLGPGLYHYEAGGHQLELVREPSPQLDQLLAIEAGGATIALESIQVVLLLSARMHRIAWKYSGLAYALVLKHVGVMYDQMYLAATAMGLAPCAIGGGDSDLFAYVSGLNYYEEPLVGEFALGRPEPGQ